MKKKIHYITVDTFYRLPKHIISHLSAKGHVSDTQNQKKKSICFKTLLFVLGNNVANGYCYIDVDFLYVVRLI